MVQRDYIDSLGLHQVEQSLRAWKPQNSPTVDTRKGHAKQRQVTVNEVPTQQA